MKKLKREIPKNYSFLDLVAPSYNRVKITPKFDGEGTPTKSPAPTSNLMRVPNYFENERIDYPDPFFSPLNPNYKPPVNSGFSMTNPYDSSKAYAEDWLNRFKETERKNNPELSQDEIDRITAEDNALNNIIDSNYGFNSSSMPRVNENISNNQLANLPNQNQWSNLQEPLPVQRPYEYADPQQAIIGSIKTDFKPADPASATLEKTKDKTDSTKGFNYKRAARVGAFNAGLNLAGNMYNMSRMNKQENLNSFITQQPEAVYPNKRMLYGDKSMFAEMGGEYSYGGMYPDGGSVYDPDAYVGQLVQYKKGGIYIKPENKGKFTAWASSHGMSVQEAASHVMANKEKYSSTTVKRANFAKNASKWKKEKGGEVDNDKEMVDGVADILSRVNDVDNRKELARYMTNQFNDENVNYDYDQFLAATNLMEMAYGGMYPYGGPITPIFTSNRFDPRLRNYNDSLSLYRAYEFQRNNFRPGYEAWLTDVARDYPGGREALRRDREKNLGKPGTIVKPKKPLKSGFKNKNSNFDPIFKVERPIVDYYKSLVGDDPNFRIGEHASPDLWHRTINPVASYYDGAMSPVYKEPVQPVIYQEEVVKEEPVKKETVTTKTTSTPIQNLPVKWFALGTGADNNYDNILMDNKYYTKDEFEKFKAANPNFKYSQKPDSIGRKYSYGGHYIPQDVNYIGGIFIPNRVDLQEFKKGGMIKRADGSYSKRGLWDNIRANKGSGKKPTKEMLKQERKIKKGYKAGGEYMEGNEYEISGEELDRLRSLGYDVELI